MRHPFSANSRGKRFYTWLSLGFLPFSTSQWILFAGHRPLQCRPFPLTWGLLDTFPMDPLPFRASATIECLFCSPPPSTTDTIPTIFPASSIGILFPPFLASFRLVAEGSSFYLFARASPRLRLFVPFASVTGSRLVPQDSLGDPLPSPCTPAPLFLF